jgi:hypothetical protein
MSTNYTQEKLWQAVEGLATGVGRIQERLDSAARHALIRLQHGGGELAFQGHPELQARFDRLLDRLTSTPPRGDEGSIAASTRTLTDDEGRELAKEIFSLFCAATDLASIPVGFEPRKRNGR